LTTSLPIFHLGHLHSLNFYLHLLEIRYIDSLFFFRNTQVSKHSFNHVIYVMQLLLHPESDDSAQLSQVLSQFIQTLLIFTDLAHCILYYTKIIYLPSFADWDWEASSTIGWGWNEQTPCTHFSDFHKLLILCIYVQKLICKIGTRNNSAHCFWLLLKKEGTYKGKKFSAICHFFGYQARGALPSKFDCDYAYVRLTSLCCFIWNALHNKITVSLFGLGSWACVLSHPSSWFEWLHGYCDKSQESSERVEMWCCSYYSKYFGNWGSF
jgi:hypothetical protein